MVRGWDSATKDAAMSTIFYDVRIPIMCGFWDISIIFDSETWEILDLVAAMRGLLICCDEDNAGVDPVFSLCSKGAEGWEGRCHE